MLNETAIFIQRTLRILLQVVAKAPIKDLSLG